MLYNKSNSWFLDRLTPATSHIRPVVRRWLLGRKTFCSTIWDPSHKWCCRRRYCMASTTACLPRIIAPIVLEVEACRRKLFASTVVAINWWANGPRACASVCISDVVLWMHPTDCSWTSGRLKCFDARRFTGNLWFQLLRSRLSQLPWRLYVLFAISVFTLTLD